MDNGNHVTLLNLLHFVTYCKDVVSMTEDLASWSSLFTEYKKSGILKIEFQDFTTDCFPGSQNKSIDSLVKIARTFYI